MNFKKWVKSIQTVGYNGARTVSYCTKLLNIIETETWRFEKKHRHVGTFQFFQTLYNKAMKNRVENIQTAGYNGLLIAISR